MTVATTYEERMALIKQIAERRKSARKTKLAKVRAKSATTMAAVKPKKKEIEIPKESNIYAYTDASKYAKQYYGDVLFETTRYDNDWD